MKSFFNPVKKSIWSIGIGKAKATSGRVKASKINAPSARYYGLKPIRLHDYPSKNIAKKNLTWNQAKQRYPKLKPFADVDRDGVVNVFDCRPFNRKKQGIYHLPMTKKGYYRALRQRSPIVIRHKDGDLIETFGEKGITSYRKIRSEKLADLQKQYPEAGYNVQSQIDIESGSAKGILAKGRTPGKIIYRQTGYKPKPEWNPYQKEEKVRQLSVVDTKTGDVEAFQESSKWSKAAIEKERRSYRDEGDTSPLTVEEKYYPQLELQRVQESSNVEVINPHPIDEIRVKREALRQEAMEKELEVPFQKDMPAYVSEAPEETIKAFKKVTEPSAQELIEADEEYNK